MKTVRIGIGVLGGILLLACSTKKDAFINRNWHALNTKYNVLYNGNLAFEEGREQLRETYRDNYWEILPVERMEVRDEVELDSENNNPNFILAEEKAAKAIQKHGMEIEDEERNPQIDEAFLLLGKARYFDQRFVPALEAFNYVLRKYPKSNKLNQARIWREKTNIRLDNNELAIENLKRLIKYEYLKDQEYADTRASMGQAYLNLNIPDTAIQQLRVAAAYTRKNPEKGRYYYIIGQLYNELGHADSANLAFDKVIDLNRSSPRVYMINAHLQKIRNTPVNQGNREEILAYLTDLEENRENRPFLDKINRELALFHLEDENDSLAIVYFNRSLRATADQPELNARNYEDLAEYNFNLNEYQRAGSYYDSVLQNLQENTRKFRAIKKKSDNLADVIVYENTVMYADSIVTLYEMPEEERVGYFEAYVEELKRKAEEEAAEKEKRANAGFAAFAETSGGKENQGKFYFYNITSLGYGKTEFKNRWGDRALEDNWRWSNRSGSRPAEDTGELVVSGEGDGAGAINDEERFSVAYYLDRFPTEERVIDSLKKERNFANYQLGLIYKEKFKENLLAAEKLELVLASNPEERLVLPSKYNLYKIYEETGSPLTVSMKEDIIANHPDSRYAEILLNPAAVLTGSTDSPEARYDRLYKLFEAQEFLKVITGTQEEINNFTGEPIVPKLEMLKANAIGRLQGFQQFKEALNYVALNYPNNPEGKKAQQMVEEYLPVLAPEEFTEESGNTTPGNWKVVFPFRRAQNEKAVAFKERMGEILESLKYENIVSRDIYDLEQEFVVVHGFPSKEFALGFVELLKKNRDYRIDRENFVILSANYKIIQVHKNLEKYRNFMLTPKP